MRLFLARLAGLVGLAALAVGSATAQTTTVTGTITDANSNPYYPGTVAAQMVLNSGQAPPAGSIPFTSPTATSVGGMFSIVLTSGQSYVVTMCAMPVNIGPTANPTPTQVCFSSPPIPIAGTTQNVTTTLNAVAKQLGPFNQTLSVVPSGANGDVQTKSGVGFAGGTQLTALGNLANDNTWTNNQRFFGPVPWTDVTTYNARPYYFFGLSATNATMGSSVTTVTLTDPGFKNGDGITIWGAGPTWNGAGSAAPTPSTPTVTPSIAAGGTMSGIVKSTPSSATTDNYRLVGRDKFGGLTVASGVGSTATASASLGLQTATITTCTRASSVMTCNTSAPEGIITGALVHIHGGSNADFTGWFTVTSAPTTQQFLLANTLIDSSAIGASIGDSNSSTGGTVAYYLSNHITWAYNATVWEYYVCADRAGDAGYHLIGVTKPSANGWQDAQFDDFGSPFMDNQTYPLYVQTTAEASFNNSHSSALATNAICTAGASVPDPLTTTIVSGAGTGTLTLAAASSNAVTNQTALYDAGPNIVAAANAIRAGGTTRAAGNLYFPPTGNGIQQWFYPINSYTVIPANTNMILAGGLYLNETLEFASNYAVYGNWASNGVPQFGFDSVTAGFQSAGAANPMVYVNSNGSFHFVQWNDATTNGGSALISDTNGQYEVEHSAFNTGGGSADYLSMNVMARGQGSGGLNFHYDYTLFNGGPDQTIDKSWTPLVYMPPNQNGSGGLQNNQGFNMNFFKSFFNRRGVEQEMAGGNGGLFIFDNIYRQGGITPLMVEANSNGAVGGYVRFSNLTQDTEIGGTYSQWGGASVMQIEGHGIANSSTDTGGTPPPFSGFPPRNYTVSDSRIGKLPSKYATGFGNSPFCIASYPYTSDCMYFDEIQSPMRFTTNQEIFWPIQQASSVAASVVAGGSLAQPASYYYNVSENDALGVESTIATVPSTACTTSAGNQTCNVTWTDPVGHRSVNIYRSTTGLAGSWQHIALNYAGAQPYADTNGVGSGAPVNSTAGFVSAMNATGVYAPLFQCPETVAPSGTTLFDALYCDSTAHRWKMLNNNGGALTVASLIEVPQVLNHSGTIQSVPHIVVDSCTLGTSCAVTLTGASVFTSTTSYSCIPEDTTTPGTAATCTKSSGSTFAITGTGTDTIQYTLVGN